MFSIRKGLRISFQTLSIYRPLLLGFNVLVIQFKLTIIMVLNILTVGPQSRPDITVLRIPK